MVALERYKHLPWIRVIFTIIALFVIAFCVGLIVYGNTSTSNDVALSILAGISALFALGQWFYPFSPRQSEASQMPLARQLVRSSFRMGDDTAANFPYITAPIQDAYNVAAQILVSINHGGEVSKQGILILGEANAGKTRLAFEILIHALPTWPVLRWRPDFTIEKISLEESRRDKRLVIFIDDLQDYVPSARRGSDGKSLIGDSRTTTLLSLVETVFQDMQKAVIVATCRLEDEIRVRAELGQLLAKLAIIQLRRFDGDTNNPEIATIIADFQRHGSTHTQDWDGTLGSLVLGLSTKNSEYLKMQGDPAVSVLRAMKLLAKVGILAHTEQYLRTVCAEVFGEEDLLTDEKTWQEAVNQLVLKQFVTEEVEESSREFMLVIRKDSYFDQVITDYPTPDRPYQLKQDFARLQKVLVSLRNVAALVNLGVALRDLKYSQEALEIFEQVIALAPTSADAYINKGLALRDLKRHQEALEAFEQAVKLAPTSADAYIGKGLALRDLKRHQEALEAFEQAVKLDPTSAGVYMRKGLALRDLKRYQEALETFEQAVKLDPTSAGVYICKGLALRDLKRYQEALEAFEQAIKLAPTFAYIYICKWMALSDLNRYQEALEVCEQAVKLDPTSAKAYISEGKILVNLKRYQGALKAFERAIKLAPTSTDAYSGKGFILRDLKRYREALKAFDQVIVLAPTSADAYISKGLVLSDLNRYQEALETFEQAIKLDPTSVAAYMCKGNTLRDLKRYQEALETFEQAIELDPTSAGLYRKKAFMLKELGQYREAQKAYNKSRQFLPPNSV